MPAPVFEGLRDAGPLLTLGVVILIGMFFGEGAKRLRLPSITGQILAVDGGRLAAAGGRRP